MQPQAPSGGPRPSEPAGTSTASSTASTTASSTASTTPEWAVGALDKLDGLIAKVRQATTERMVKVAKIVVYGLLAAIMGTTALVLAVIAGIRALDELIPGPVWSAYLPLGAIFTAAGAFLWSKKTPKPARH